VESGAIQREEFGSTLPQRFAPEAGINRNLEIEQTSQEAGDVCLDDWDRLIEGEGHDGVRSVTANSWQSPNRLQRLGKSAAISRYDGLCGRAEVASSRVIAETLPGVKNFVFRRGGKSGKIREAPHPLIKVWDDRGDLRLLEHELRNENCVRIVRPAPRQFAAVARKPAGKDSPKKS
jgi:hypothetical protein